MSRRALVAQLVVAALLAVAVNLALSSLEVAHDAPLVALLAGAVVTACALALAAVDTLTRVSWLARRTDARPSSGEDTRTASFRHLVEIHETSREADDAVLWQLADLAAGRLRQVHGLRYADDPERATVLLGPVLADLVSHDRRHRYQPGTHKRRYAVAALGELVGRIERL